MLFSVCDGGENTVGKGENARYHSFHNDKSSSIRS